MNHVVSDEAGAFIASTNQCVAILNPTEDLWRKVTTFGLPIPQVNFVTIVGPSQIVASVNGNGLYQLEDLEVTSTVFDNHASQRSSNAITIQNDAQNVVVEVSLENPGMSRSQLKFENLQAPELERRG